MDELFATLPANVAGSSNRESPDSLPRKGANDVTAACPRTEGVRALNPGTGPRRADSELVLRLGHTCLTAGCDDDRRATRLPTYDPGPSNPSRTARTAASVRDLAPILDRMFVTCLFTVNLEQPSLAEISLSESPLAIRSSVVNSRKVSE